MASLIDYDDLRRILLDDWDPIGVRDVKMAQDEYDDYAHQILSKLSNGALARDVEGYLVDVETEIMGQTPDRERARRVADMLYSSVREPARRG